LSRSNSTTGGRQFCKTDTAGATFGGPRLAAFASDIEETDEVAIHDGLIADGRPQI